MNKTSKPMEKQLGSKLMKTVTETAKEEDQEHSRQQKDKPHRKEAYICHRKAAERPARNA